MKAISSKILLSMLLFATCKIHAMLLPSQSDMEMAESSLEKRLITLGSIENQMSHPDRGGNVECLVNHKEIGSVDSGERSTINKILFRSSDQFPAIKRLALERRHQQKGFKEFRLKLEVDASNLKI